MDVIKKHTGTKTVNGRKYLFAGMSETLKKAEKMASEDNKVFITKIFKLEDGKTNYPYRVYVRIPIKEYDQRSGRVMLKK